MQRFAAPVGSGDDSMNRSTVRRIAALERDYEGRYDVAALGLTPWQALQSEPPMTLDQWTALAAPQQVGLQRDYHP
jgi:hypothetical protein